jgi:hypothetical protein
MTETDTRAESPGLPPIEFDQRTWPPDFPAPRRISAAWREGTLTRAAELASLRAWLLWQNHGAQSTDPLWASITRHLDEARTAVGKRGLWASITGSAVWRAMSNLDAAEADLLRVSSPEYLMGQMPSLLNQVQRHLDPKDPRRQEFERIARELGVTDSHPPVLRSAPPKPDDLNATIREARGRIVSTVRAASSEALREQLRVRSFRNVLIATAAVLTVVAAGLAVIGYVSPATVPLCFQPEKSGQTVVVCPTAQSQLLQTGQQSGPVPEDIDDVVKRTAGRGDLFIVELVGLIAAAIAAAATLRGIRGSSEPYGLPVALAALKLPTGAVTAFLGLLLMRGQFVPGLSALDTSAQILAWALVFGYAQQLFTRLVDQQAHTVLNTVRGADRGKEAQPNP